MILQPNDDMTRGARKDANRSKRDHEPVALFGLGVSPIWLAVANALRKSLDGVRTGPQALQPGLLEALQGLR